MSLAKYLMEQRAVYIYYTNWKGETAWRPIIPISWEWTSNEWHPDKQWIMLAYDLDKKAERHFAMLGVSRWLTPEQFEREAISVYGGG